MVGLLSESREMKRACFRQVIAHLPSPRRGEPLYHLLFSHFIQTTNRAPLFRTPNRSPLLRKPYRDIPETTPVQLLFDLASPFFIQIFPGHYWWQTQ